MIGEEYMKMTAELNWLREKVEVLQRELEKSEADLASMRSSVYAACSGTGCLNAHELRQALDQAEADRDVLAAEVRAWRIAFDEDTGRQIGSSSDCRDVSSSRYTTDTSGALDRAKEQP